MRGERGKVQYSAEVEVMDCRVCVFCRFEAYGDAALREEG